MRVAVKSALAAVAIVSAAGLYMSLLPFRPAAESAPFSTTVVPITLPELHFEDAAGRARTLADFRGKVVLLNLWATWCAPCREEMPALDRLRAVLGGKDFEVLALSLDQQGAARVKAFFAANGIKALHPYIDPTALAGSTLGAFGLPTTLLIDREGREIGRHTGAAKWDAPEIVADLRRRQAH